MNAVQAWQFEDSAVDQAITALCIAPVQFGIGAAWVAWQAVRFTIAMLAWLFAAAGENAKGIATLAGIVAVTVVLVTVWQVGVGVGVIAALTFCLKRRGKI